MVSAFGLVQSTNIFCSLGQLLLAVRQGVRQGAVLSPLLYAVYTSNSIFELESCGYGISIGPLVVGTPTYADDMAIIANTPWKLQALLKIISEYAFKWRYSFNSLSPIFNCVDFRVAGLAILRCK